jgi:hypothetical protein
LEDSCFCAYDESLPLFVGDIRTQLGIGDEMVSGNLYTEVQSPARHSGAPVSGEIQGLGNRWGGTELFFGGEQLHSPESDQSGFGSGDGISAALSLEQFSSVFDASDEKAEVVVR